VALTSRRRTAVAVAALGLPVVAVVSVLGLRAAAGGSPDVQVLQVDVDEVARGISGSGGISSSGATAGPDRPSTLGAPTAPGPGETFEVTIVCTSVDGTDARLTVTVEKAVVVERGVDCADGSEADAEPGVTSTPDVPLPADWSIEVAGGTPAAVAVVVVPV
jgi:hypothetical protein